MGTKKQGHSPCFFYGRDEKMGLIHGLTERCNQVTLVEADGHPGQPRPDYGPVDLDEPPRVIADGADIAHRKQDVKLDLRPRWKGCFGREIGAPRADISRQKFRNWHRVR